MVNQELEFFHHPFCWSEGLDGLGQGGHYFGKLVALGGGDPGELDSAGLDADVLENAAEDGESAASGVIAALVVAITGVATADQDTVDAALQGAEDKADVDSSGTGQADNPHVARILQARDAG